MVLCSRFTRSLRALFESLILLLFLFNPTECHALGVGIGVDAATTTASKSSSAVPEPTPSVMVDILSSQPQFSYFLRHLQRKGMIPELNLMQNVTLLAPVNSAFVGMDASDDLVPGMNQLLRYVVNQTVVIGNLSNEEVVYDSLYQDRQGDVYPIRVREDGDEYVVDEVASIVEPDLYAKHQWSYIQGIDHLLPLKSSLCDVLMGEEIPEISLVNKIFQSLFDDEDEDNDDDDDDDDEAGSLRKNKKSKNKKNKKTKKNPGKKPKPIPKTCDEFLHGVGTMVIPSDSLLRNSLDELQLEYYLANAEEEFFDSSEEAILEVKLDTLDLFKNLMFSGYIDGVNGTTSKSTSFAGRKHQFIYKGKGVELGKKFHSSQTHVLSNGIIQIFDEGEWFFDRLDIPTAEMIARKALYAKHYSNFVSELNFRSLDYLIDGSVANQTILVDIDSRDDIGDESEIESNSFSLKQEFLYHFIDGLVDFRHHEHHLVDTKLCSKKKLGTCYKMKISKYTEGGEDEGGEGVREVVKVGDGIKISDVISIQNHSQIYIATEEISTPMNLKHALGDLMSTGAIPRHLEGIKIDREGCLRTLNYLNTFNLYSLDDNEKGYSIFLPCGATDSKNAGVWDGMGLVLKYLENNPLLFQEIIQGMFLEDLIYSNFKNQGIFKNMNGRDVAIRSLNIKNEINHLQFEQDEPISMPLNSDILFNQGVIHVINEVLLPSTFHVPIQELIKTTADPQLPQFDFANLLATFPKLASLLTGKKPFSVLIPTAESLESFNKTAASADLFDFLCFHLIANEEVHKIIDCINGEISDDLILTNLTNGALVCKHGQGSNKVYLSFKKLNGTEDEKIVHGVSYNKDQEVRILSHGCTSPEYKNNFKNASCVFLLDKPLNLEWFDDSKKDPFLHVHLGWVSVGIGIILGLTIFGAVMLGLLICVGRRDKRRRSSHDNEIPRMDSGFMSVLTDDDDYIPYDRGYETDIDLLRSEADALLPNHVKKKRKIRPIDYGSTKTENRNGPSSASGNKDQVTQATLPRDIGANGVKKTLNRDRNIPGVTQF
ncbi:uncharacterized protein LODBEIA_P58010 [Lodderomyces beijingensis]|uniref:FAS1 domain-containing protein n=1 Tax=Lodderomyces beijingensis TaxID=1775926 RepID=A0ABP0ZTX7_9ASCO